MLVSGFMVKAADVVTCKEEDTIAHVLDTILERSISAVVVVNSLDFPVGIITKTDLVRAFKQRMSIDETASSIMTQPLKTVLDTDDRDKVAKSFEHHGNHHAIVLDKDGGFKGLVSAWDVAAEVAKDSRAWPWNRTAEGRIAPVH